MVHTSPKDESRQKKESEREYWGEMERRLVKIDFIHWSISKSGRKKVRESIGGNGKRIGENRFYSLEYFKSGRK